MTAVDTIEESGVDKCHLDPDHCLGFFVPSAFVKSTKCTICFSQCLVTFFSIYAWDEMM